MAKKTPKATKPLWEMTTAELAEATKEFDQPMVAKKFRPLTPAERKRWERLSGSPGRPKVGKGAQVVSVSLERGLLSQSDELAKQLGLSRAALIARGLKTLLAVNGQI